MAISTDFLDAVALAAGRFPGPLVLPWPISGRPDGFLTFASFAEWRLFVMNLSLHAVVPEIVRAKFERAQNRRRGNGRNVDALQCGMIALPPLLKASIGYTWARRGGLRQSNVCNFVWNHGNLSI